MLLVQNGFKSILTWRWVLSTTTDSPNKGRTTTGYRRSGGSLPSSNPPPRGCGKLNKDVRLVPLLPKAWRDAIRNLGVLVQNLKSIIPEGHVRIVYMSGGAGRWGFVVTNETELGWVQAYLKVTDFCPSKLCARDIPVALAQPHIRPPEQL